MEFAMVNKSSHLADARCTQFNLHDAVCIFSLLAVMISGIAHRMHELPNRTFVTRMAVTSPMPGIADVTIPVGRKWHPMLVGGIVAGSIAIIAVFLAARLLFCKAGRDVRQSVSRIGAAVSCVVTLLTFWWLAPAVLLGKYRQALEPELAGNLSQAACSRGVFVAIIAAVIVATVEFVSLPNAARNHVS
jgi:hypothetical protein